MKPRSRIWLYTLVALTVAGGGALLVEAGGLSGSLPSNAPVEQAVQADSASTNEAGLSAIPESSSPATQESDATPEEESKPMNLNVESKSLTADAPADSAAPTLPAEQPQATAGSTAPQTDDSADGASVDETSTLETPTAGTSTGRASTAGTPTKEAPTAETPASAESPSAPTAQTIPKPAAPKPAQEATTPAKPTPAATAEAEIAVDDEALIPALKHMQAGEYTEAAKLLEGLIARNADNSDYHAWLAACYGSLIEEVGVFQKLKYNSAMEKEIKEALRLDPESTLARMVQGRRHLNAPSAFGGDVNKAIEDFRYCIEHGRDDAEIYYFLGLGYEKKGDKAKAREAYEQALSQDAAYEKAQLQLDKLKKR